MKSKLYLEMLVIHTFIKRLHQNGIFLEILRCAAIINLSISMFHDALGDQP